MRSLRVAGWILFALVVAVSVGDLVQNMRSKEPHSFLSVHHVFILLIAIFALSLTSSKVLDNVARYSAALRGIRHAAELQSEEHETQERVAVELDKHREWVSQPHRRIERPHRLRQRAGEDDA